MNETKQVEIIKGKFKGVKGFVFVSEMLMPYPKVTVFDKDGNEYWVDEKSVKVVEE